MTNQDYRRKLEEHYKLLADDSEITASAAARNLNGWAPQAIEHLLSQCLLFREALTSIVNSGVLPNEDHPLDVCRCGTCAVRRLVR